MENIEDLLTFEDSDKKMRIKDEIHILIDDFPLDFSKKDVMYNFINSKRNPKSCYQAIKREKTKRNIFENVFTHKLVAKMDIYDSKVLYSHPITASYTQTHIVYQLIDEKLGLDYDPNFEF